jgi:hypothetical protein
MICATATALISWHLALIQKSPRTASIAITLDLYSPGAQAEAS